MIAENRVDQRQARLAVGLIVDARHAAEQREQMLEEVAVGLLIPPSDIREIARVSVVFDTLAPPGRLHQAAGRSGFR